VVGQGGLHGTLPSQVEDLGEAQHAKTTHVRQRRGILDRFTRKHTHSPTGRPGRKCQLYDINEHCCDWPIEEITAAAATQPSSTVIESPHPRRTLRKGRPTPLHDRRTSST
jgi:hypothetical protein